MAQTRISVTLTLDEWEEVYHMLSIRVRETNSDSLRRIQRKMAGQMYAHTADALAEQA